MTAPAAYATDELRLLASLSGTALPPSLDSTWLNGDEVVADVVAARVLLARGMISLRGSDTLRVTAAVEKIFAPLRHATTIVEVECRVAGSGTRREIAACGPEGGVHLVEREPDVWQLATCGSLPELTDLLPATATPLEVSFTVDASAFDRTRLDRRFASEEVPTAFLSALDSWRTEVVVRAAQRLGDDRFALDELWWIDSGEHGLWLLTRQESAITGTTGRVDDLRAAIAELERPA